MLNKIILQGRLTKDPEIRLTANQTAFCNFSVASERSFSGQDGQRQTDFINCIAWKQKAQFLGQYFHKGDMILLSGTLQSRNYQDNNGQNRTAFEVLVEDINFCGGGQRQTQPQAQAQPPVYPDLPTDTDALPFEI